MSKNEGVVEQLPLKNIQADVNQPRKDFNASRLAELVSSIKKHGIMNPLVVERMKGGLYQLVDGERRFRASQELGLKTVPAIVVDEMSDTERLVKQFHLQEQHQGWSPVEKAVAIGHLAESLGSTPVEIAKMLDLPERTIRDYIGFWSLSHRKEYQKSEMPIALAHHIVRTVSKAKKLYEKTFEEEFTREECDALERTIIAQVKKGDLKKVTDFAKLYDVFVADPDNIKKFMKGKSSTTELYLKSNAKVAHHARNAMQLINLVENHMKQTAELGGLELIKDNQGAVRQAKRVISLLQQVT